MQLFSVNGTQTDFSLDRIKNNRSLQNSLVLEKRYFIIIKELERGSYEGAIAELW